MAIADDPTQAEPPRAALHPNVVRGRFTLGTSVAHYELIRPLGHGGMGEVWLARDTRLGRRVALKFLLNVNAKYAERFMVEAKATARLSHENIVALYDLGEHSGCPYMVLEYVPGKTLSSWLMERKNEAQTVGVPSARIASLMLPVARALHCAHQAGIVHRDLKPANIMLADHGPVKVLDFGVAKLLGEADDLPSNDPNVSPRDWLARENPSLTETGALVGTRAYMAPEQWWGAPVDAQTDIWAMGIIMYQMALGAHPCGSMSDPSALLDVSKAEKPMPSVRERVPDIGRLGIVIDRCLLKFREDRLSSAAELCQQLEEISREHLGARSDKHEEEINPYAGLAAFQERDAALFFGRESLVEHILWRLADVPFIALVGSSGAGKSSLARAGVVPALVRGGEAWEAFMVRPGARPLQMLADLLVQHSWQKSSTSAEGPLSLRTRSPGESNQRDVLVEQLQKEPGFFGVQLRNRAARRRECILLFVDQFEEAFTLASEQERQLFFQCLTGAGDDPESPVRIMISIRHDFLDRVASFSGILAEHISRGTVLVGPLNRSGLHRALVAPAEVFSYRFESEALINEMVDALAHTTSALPLLQFTAARLWDGRDRKRHLLTEATYRQFGGVEGALASHANNIVAAMSGPEKKWAKTLLLRLVTSESTRAIVTRRELTEMSGNAAIEAESVLTRLVNARLVVVEGTGAESTLELIHESLITKWPQLHQWLEEDKDEARFLMRLQSAAKEWEREGRPEGLLWRAESADEARRYWKLHAASAGSSGLRVIEAQFLEAVVSLGDRERRRKHWIAGGVMASLGLVAIVVSVLALQANQEAARANQETIRANQETIRTKNANVEAELNALRARNATRLAVAREHQDDPTTVLALLREVETESVPRGWNDLVVTARNASQASAVLLHDDAVRDVQFHPDGKRIVTACLDGTVRIWNADGSGEPFVLRGHESSTWSAAYSPDGKQIVSASRDHTIRIWNSDGTGQPIVLQGHEEGVNEAAYSPDGKRVISASADKTVRIWNADGSGKPVVLRGHGDTVYTAAFLRDGVRVVTGGFDNTVRIWNADGSGTPNVLRGHEGFVYAVAVHPDGKLVASASNDKTIRIWSIDDAKPSLILRGHEGEVYGIAFSEDGKQIVSASQDKTVRIWNTDGSGKPTIIRGHVGNANRVAFSRDGKRVASASYDQSARVWNVNDSAQPHVIHSSTAAAYGARFSPDGHFIAGATEDGDILLWRSRDMELVRVFPSNSTFVINLAWSPDNRRIVAGDESGKLQILTVDGDANPIKLRGHDAIVESVAWSHDGRRIASASLDKTVRIWDADIFKEIFVFREHSGEVTSIAFSHDDKRIVSSSMDKTVRIWNVDGSGQTLILPHQTMVNAAAWNNDDSQIVTAAFDRKIRSWNTRGDGSSTLFPPHDDTPSISAEAAFSPDGKRFLTFARNGVFRIWNTDGQGEPLSLNTGKRQVFSAVYSPDGRQVLTASGDGSITLWRNLEPMAGPDDARLWSATSYCMPLELRQKWLGFDEAQSRADLERCRDRVQRNRQGN